MSEYKKSSGETKDTSDMPTSYIERALAKAKREGNQSNVDVLQEELDSRK